MEPGTARTAPLSLQNNITSEEQPPAESRPQFGHSVSSQTSQIHPQPGVLADPTASGQSPPLATSATLPGEPLARCEIHPGPNLLVATQGNTTMTSTAQVLRSLHNLGSLPQHLALTCSAPQEHIASAVTARHPGYHIQVPSEGWSWLSSGCGFDLGGTDGCSPVQAPAPRGSKVLLSKHSALEFVAPGENATQTYRFSLILTI